MARMKMTAQVPRTQGKKAAANTGAKASSSKAPASSKKKAASPPPSKRAAPGGKAPASKPAANGSGKQISPPPMHLAIAEPPPPAYPGATPFPDSPSFDRRPSGPASRKRKRPSVREDDAGPPREYTPNTPSESGSGSDDDAPPDVGARPVRTSARLSGKRQALRSKPRGQGKAGAAAEMPNPFAQTGPTLTALRNGVRSLSRLLAHDEENAAASVGVSAKQQQPGRRPMPATVRAEKERELAQRRLDLAEAEAKRDQRAALAKHHRARFFEKTKAGRAVRRETKKLDALRADGSPADDIRRHEALVYAARVDEMYAIYAPLGETYISLWGWDAKKKESEEEKGAKKEETDTVKKQEASSDDEAPDTKPRIKPDPDADPYDATLAAVRETKPAVWVLVERAAAQNRLAEVRDGRHEDLAALGMGNALRVQRFLTAAGIKAEEAEKLQKNSVAANERDVQMGDARDGDESDGGFFE